MAVPPDEEPLGELSYSEKKNLFEFAAGGKTGRMSGICRGT